MYSVGLSRYILYQIEYIQFNSKRCFTRITLNKLMYVIQKFIKLILVIFHFSIITGLTQLTFSTTGVFKQIIRHLLQEQEHLSYSAKSAHLMWLIFHPNSCGEGDDNWHRCLDV